MEELLLNIQKICKEDLELDVNLSELKSDGGIYAELGPVLTKDMSAWREKSRGRQSFLCANPPWSRNASER